MRDLFRSEAVAHKSQRFHGAVILTRTWSFPALTLFFAVLIAAIIAFACLFGFTRKETVTGMVVPNHGLIRLVAPQSGLVNRIEVSEGQEVRAGDLLFVLDSERDNARGGAQAAINASLASRIARLHEELEQLERQHINKREELEQRLRNLRATERMHEDELDLRRRKVHLAREAALRMGELAEGGSVPRNIAQEKNADLLDQESRLAAIGLEQMELKRQLASAVAAATDLPLQAAREASQLRRAIEELEQQSTESELRRQVFIRADQPGRIAGVVIDRGQSVGPDQRLASLLPSGSLLEVELYAPTRAAGFVRAGTEVLLRYDAFPYQKFGQFKGKVREVSLNAIPMNELQRMGGRFPGGADGASSEPVYRIRVFLERQEVEAAGGIHVLKPGMQLSASLVLEKRTLVEWVLAPLAGIGKRV
jgi:membrane fusion protein